YRWSQIRSRAIVNFAIQSLVIYRCGILLSRKENQYKNGEKGEISCSTKNFLVFSNGGAFGSGTHGGISIQIIFPISGMPTFAGLIFAGFSSVGLISLGPISGMPTSVELISVELTSAVPTSAVPTSAVPNSVPMAILAMPI